MPDGAITIAPPPRTGGTAATASQGWPLLLPLLSGAGSLPLLLGSPSSGRRWILLGTVASLLLSTGAGLGLRLLARRAAERARRQDRARYLAHLRDVAGRVARVAALQRAAAEHLHPDVATLPAMADERERVWERSPSDDDFLAVRLGRGPVPLAAPLRLDLGRDPLADHDPQSLAAAEDLARGCSPLDGLPVAVSLHRVGVVAVHGPPDASRSLIRSVLLRAALFHAPRDLRVLALFPPDAAPAWDWLKWLPHVRDDTSAGPSGAVPRCRLAPTPHRAAELLAREVAPRLASPSLASASSGGGGLHSPATAAGSSGDGLHLPAAAGGSSGDGLHLPAAAAGSSGGGLHLPAAGHSADGRPHLLVVVDGYAPHGAVGRLPVVDALLRAAPALEATVVCTVGQAADEPTATRLRVALDDHGGLTITDVTVGGAGIAGVRADQADLAVSEAVARRLAPLWLDDPATRSTGDRPSPARLLDVLGVPSPRALDPTFGWSPRPEPELLRVPIGLPDGPTRTPRAVPGTDPSSAPFTGLSDGSSSGRGDPVALDLGPLALDLKEAADGGMGPHGLLVGATGSGKSELLRTIVTGLALTHPPEVLAFVLVDFKGGAAFAGLARLPHTAGLITNLQSEPTMVERARSALHGELERRQRLLRDAGDLDSIAMYRQRRSGDDRMEPLPRLLVVVDEFGELLAAHPEFLDLFTAIGRTGRSLGIQLLLASQRLEAGRLRGLDSHLRYRICLRTFSPAESSAVLDRPDAYHLPPAPGHGLLKVDSDPCRRFRGLLVSGAPPIEAHQARSREGPGCTLVLPFGPVASPPQRSLADEVPGGGPPDPGAGAPAMPSDLDQVVAAMAPLAASGRHTHRVWLAPLPETLTLREVLEGGSSPGTGSEPPPRSGVPAALGPPPRPGSPRAPGEPGWLRVPVGIVDKPFEQSQDPLLLDFAGPLGHLAIAGAPRSGKSTLLATLVAAFALTHPPDQAQLYCVDLGGGLLNALACLPHVGAVLGAHEPTEIRRLVRELRALVAEREQAFRDHRIASMAAWHARRRAEPALDPDGYGEVFLVIDNWARLRQDLPDLEPEIESLARAGLHYGVHLVVAANRWADLRLSLRDNIGGRLELRLNDPIESEVGRAAAARLLQRSPGRGLSSDGHEFQVALPVLDPTGAGLGPEIACHAIQSQSPTRMGAPPLHPLPILVRFEDLPPPARGADPPIANAGPPVPARGAGPPVRGAGPPARGVPFALHDHRLEVVRLDLAAGPHFLVLGDRECGKTATLRCVAHGLTAFHDPGALRLAVVDYRRTLPDLAGTPHCDTYAATPAAAAEMAARLRSVLEPRLLWSLDDPAGTARPWQGSGPRYVLVVDDYDLVAAAGRNPLEPLLDLVAVGRDVGLHVLLARPVGGTGRSSFEPFYQRVRETGCPGLIMSGDPREGPLLGGHSATPQPAGRGYLVTRHGRPGLVQVAWTPPRAGGPPAPPAASPAPQAPPAPP